jgi:MoaE-MoaD fusion protein
MRVRVLFFGMLKDLAGKSSESIDLPEGTSIRELLAQYEAQIPRLKQFLASVALAINQEYASPDARLKEGDEIALLPPVSGGGPGSADDLLAGQPRRARIVREAIDGQGTALRLRRGDDGAVVVFEGTVRNQTRGRQTLYLEYEAYEEMALREMESLAAHALEKFQIRDVAIVHRLGRLEIGETGVLIVVASAHRAAAFEACRWIIDTLKRTVPIWKKEHFVDGVIWADGEPFPEEIARAHAADSRANSPADRAGNSRGPGSPAAGPASK